MSAQMNELLLKKILILVIGRVVTTEYRVLPSIRYSAEPSNRTEYRFSPTYYIGNKYLWTIICGQDYPGIVYAIMSNFKQLLKTHTHECMPHIANLTQCIT